ncbi:hypothetical protein L596_027618 [Steinernema carpocapsae]|uniref:Uncharacterized protein n=1 Tax=Steinernema carpocapsae TaxID=34508 RepID=A0A4U5LW14_STECR|nr:hypothetical protein L596_027618 [Steinernema carpocapsae]
MQLRFSAALVILLVAINAMMTKAQGIDCYNLPPPPPGPIMSYGGGAMSYYYNYGTPQSCSPNSYGCLKYVCAGAKLKIF